MSRDPGERRRVLLFGKVPRPGRTKTRLAPALGEEGAARLYRAFLDDTVRLAGRSVAEEVELWLAGRPAGSDGTAVTDRHAGLRVRRQVGDGLGERLRGAFAAAFDEGVDLAAVLGTDHPTLPPARIDEAFASLAAAEAVLGPTRDGGYYLLALRREAWPRAAALFREIPWSTREVAAVTRRRAREAGVEIRSLATWYDVDEPAELERLREDVDPATATARALTRLDAASD